MGSKGPVAVEKYAKVDLAFHSSKVDTDRHIRLFLKNFKGDPDYLKPFRIIPLFYGSIEYQWYLEDGAFAGNILKD